MKRLLLLFLFLGSPFYSYSTTYYQVEQVSLQGLTCLNTVGEVFTSYNCFVGMEFTRGVFTYTIETVYDSGNRVYGSGSYTSPENGSGSFSSYALIAFGTYTTESCPDGESLNDDGVCEESTDDGGDDDTESCEAGLETSSYSWDYSTYGTHVYVCASSCTYKDNSSVCSDTLGTCSSSLISTGESCDEDGISSRSTSGDDSDSGDSGSDDGSDSGDSGSDDGSDSSDDSGSSDGSDSSDDSTSDADLDAVVSAVDTMNSSVTSALNSIDSAVVSEGNQTQAAIEALNSDFNEKMQANTDAVTNVKDSVDLVNDSVSDVKDSVDAVGESVDGIASAVDGIGDDVGTIADAVTGLGNLDTSGAGLSDGCLDGETCESFYTPSYPDGIVGVFNDRFDSIAETVTSGISDIFGSIDLSNASRPSLTMEFWLLGTFDFNDYIDWDTIFYLVRIIMYISTLFACRKIIFGG
ncbi:hypothetical protein [Vibrio nitrifigilis]|uniref:Methyl-accepting chemotaxis protein n=1 Tax=Vibrio nitrifigilis TaxID=2789781 RepID=A0ABS0GDM2_9VIBR|nr:hypothetical protein [Vibrio nitrifigilis]MBF9000486.1 hypothetical protein [Vibrio nitrifigilis]MBF9001577.1 hypothetical protein [Vibrio nitrifigilis]MBF9002643.1 hypothetical protein [Vibrio nitrifigilis]